MCLLFETIKVINNELQHIDYHNNRVNNTLGLLFQITHPWDLSEIIQVPQLNQNTTYRCRFNYSKEPEGFEFIPYVKRDVRTLFLVDCGEFEYPFKYSDRSALEKMKNSIPDPEISDILLVKNGLITDTSFSNIALFDGRNWYTPTNPLLKGTKREFYIDHLMLIKRDIKPADLHQFIKARLINAMLDMEDEADIPVDKIIS
jgi:4-amino-4-deoxychorismate lyase